MQQQNLNLYHIFYETASCGNISAAARNLYISQPAISKAIAKLESNLSVSLFTRNSRGVKLTPEGKLLYRQVSTAFQAISRGEEQLRQNLELGVGQLSIGVSTTLCRYMLLPYLQAFICENPRVKLSIYCQSSLETIAGLESGKLDIGLIGENDHIGELAFLPVREIQDIFVSTREYLSHLTECGSGDENELLRHATLMLLDKKNITRQYVEKYLILQDITPEQQLEVTTMDLLIEFAKIGMGVACVVRDFVEEELKNGMLIPFPIKGEIPKRKIGFAYKKQTNPTNAAVMKFLSLDREGGNGFE